MWSIIALAVACLFLAWGVIELGIYLMLPRLRDDEPEW